MSTQFPGFVAPGPTEPTSFLMDAGVVTVGGIALAYVWGPTRGGWSWDDGAQERVVPADGIFTETVGLRRIIGWDAHIKGKVLLASATAIQRYLPGSTSDGSTGSSGNTITNKTARTPFVSGDYMQDVYFHGNRSDQKAIRIYAPWAIVVKWPFSLDDNNEGLFDVDIKLVNPAATPNICPFVLQVQA